MPAFSKLNLIALVPFCLLLTACNPLASAPVTEKNYGAGLPTVTDAPSVSQVARLDSSPSASATLRFAVVFNVSVTGVSLSNFHVTSSGTSGNLLTSLSGSGSSYIVTVSAGTGNGTLRLDVVSSPAIINVDGVTLTSDFSSGEAYDVVRSVPTAPSALTFLTPSSSPSNISAPTVRVSGVSSGTTVSVYTTSSCSAGSMVGSQTATASTTDITLSNLADGAYTFYATAANLAGASSCSVASLPYSLQTTLPLVTGLANDATPHTSKTWTWGCSKSPCTYRYAVDTSNAWTAAGSFSAATMTTQASGDTTYYVHVQSMDAFGNLSAVQTASAVLYAPMTVATASVPMSGDVVVIDVTAPTAPLLPATGVTGFSVQVNGSPVTVASAARSTNTQVTLTLAGEISSTDTITFSYALGNLTDSATPAHPLMSYSAQPVTNNSTLDSDAVSYFRAVIANAGTLSATTKSAIKTLVGSLKADSLWGKLIEFYPMAGNQLNAAVVKLKAKSGNLVALTNSAFVAADYTEATGFKGNGSTKYFDTNISVPTLTQTSLLVGAYVTTDSTAAVPAGGIIGSSYTPSGNADRFYLFGYGGNGSLVGQAGLGSQSPGGILNGAGLRAMTYDGTDMRGYKGPSMTLATTVPGLVWQATGTVHVFHIGGGFFHDGRIATAFIGTALTPAEWALFNTDVQTFETALSR